MPDWQPTEGREIEEGTQCFDVEVDWCEPLWTAVVAGTAGAVRHHQQVRRHDQAAYDEQMADQHTQQPQVGAQAPAPCRRRRR